MMILGPEFRRNIWLRFSFFSILLMPLLIGAGLLLSYLSFFVHDATRLQLHLVSGGDLSTYGLYPHWSYRSFFISMPMFFITLYVLGTYEAASSFTNELRNKTWDIQKISAIRPIHLILGKLFGVTSYAWYFSSGLLAVVLFAYSYRFDSAVGSMGDVVLVYPSPKDIISLAVLLVFPAFVGHLVAVLASLRALSKKSTGSFISLILGGAASFVCFYTLLAVLDIMFMKPETAFKNNGDFRWFSNEIGKEVFVFLGMAFFVFWGGIALHRMARRELNFPAYPFVWIMFLVTLSLYLTGFVWQLTPENPSQIIADIDAITQLCLFPFLIFFFATYFSLYYESDRVGNYIRFLRSLKDKQFKRAVETIPSWLPSLFVTCLIISACVWGIFQLVWDSSDATLAGKSHTSSWLSEEWFIKGKAGILSVFFSLVLFMLRDGIVMHICLLGNRFKRGGLMIATYYLFAYMILPALVYYSLEMFFGVGTVVLKEIFHSEFEYAYIIAMFVPTAYQSFSHVLLPVTIQILIFSYILWRVTAVYRTEKPSQKT